MVIHLHPVGNLLKFNASLSAFLFQMINEILLNKFKLDLFQSKYVYIF